MKCAARCSSRSAALLQIAARVAAGVRLQARNPSRAADAARLIGRRFDHASDAVSVDRADSCRCQPLAVDHLRATARSADRCSNCPTPRARRIRGRANFSAAADRDRAAGGCSGAAAWSALPMMSAGRRSSVATGTVSSAASAHKRRVGAVLQQPPHQIGQEIAVAADRRIGTAGDLGASRRLGVERLAHAMQALELESALATGQFEQGRDRQRIVGGELREDPRPQRQQFLRAGDVIQSRSSPCG